MSKDLSKMFNPKSIAVIGASADPKKVGAIVLKNIIVSGFEGIIYPINPNIQNIGSLKFFPNVTTLPEVVDLAVIAIPAMIVNGTMEEIGKKGIKNVILLSAGYKESGETGAKLEKELIEIANKYEINVIGPNCLGLVNNSCPMNATFGEVIKNPGNLRIISQSGALATAMFDWCEAQGMGFDQLVTVGNKAVITENEILEYWSESGEIFPVGLYLESITNGDKFRSLVTNISQKSPVFILKPGKSVGAVKAMHSHTGSIAGEDYVLEEALKETGAIRCQELGDFFDLARALSWVGVPQNPRVAVVSNAGGPGVLSTDTISRVGLELAEFSEETNNKLKAFLPPAASIHNPIDVMGDALADRFEGALEAVLGDENVGAVVVILTPQLMTQIEETAKVISNLGKIYSQPILCSFVGGVSTANGNKILNNFKIPTFDFPESAIQTLAKMWEWEKWRKEKPTLTSLDNEGQLVIDKEKVKEILMAAKEKGQPSLDNIEADDLMKIIGVPVVPTKNVSNIDEAKEFARENGWPVVLKLSAPGLLHKSDIGGVITQIKDENKLTESWQVLTEKKMGQIQIQKEIEDGVEVIIGIKRDSVFGPVLLFGAGGKMTELLADRNLHLLPISLMEAEKMVAGSRIYKLLSGFRSEKAYDLKETYEIMVKLAKLVEKTPEIAEVEINPVKVTNNGTWALDAKVVLS